MEVSNGVVVGAVPLGVPVWRGFAFDYTMQHDLVNGVPIYTPAHGEFVMGALILNEIVWNGTTPSADVGPYGSPLVVFGWFAGILGPMDLTQIGSPIPPTRAGLSSWDISPLTYVNGIMQADVTGPLPQLVTIAYPTGSGVPVFPDSPLPARFDGNTPVVIQVSQDGTRNILGDPNDPSGPQPPGATQGESKVYLLTAVPLV